MKQCISAWAPRIILAFGFAISTLSGETLYLLKGAIALSGSSKPWRSEILRVDEKAGSLSVARDLGTEKFDGIAFCLVNYEHRAIVIGMPSFQPNTFVLVEMDDLRNPVTLRPDFTRPLAVTWEAWPPHPDRRIKFEPPKQVMVSEAALLFHANLGLVLALRLLGPNGMADYAVPIRRGPLPEARGLSKSERAAFTSSGTIGLGSHGQTSSETVLPYDSNLKLYRGGAMDLGIPSPQLSSAVRTAGKPFRLHINDGRSMMLQSAERGGPDSSKAGEGSSTLYVRDKKGGRWHTITVPGEAPHVRSIGKYLLGVARSDDFKRERQSAGRAEYEEIAKHVRWQDGIEASGANHAEYYPGILFAIDVETGKLFQWRTNQADSEILWADDAAFYYRRANELLKVEIVQGASGPVIGPVSSILKADILLDVHAAFRGK